MTMLGNVGAQGAVRSASVLLVAACLTACKIVPDPPANVPPAMPIGEIVGEPGVPHSSVITAAGPAVTVAEAGVGDAVIKFPYRYKHTAVLTEDVKGFSITVWNVQAPAGAPGFFAGAFTMSGNGQ